MCVCVRVRACWYMGLYSSSKEGGCVQGKRRVQSEQKKEREIQDPKVEMSSSERNQQQQGESSAKDNGCCCLHNTNSKKQQQHAQQQRLRRRKKTGHRLVHGGKTGPSFQHPPHPSNFEKLQKWTVRSKGDPPRHKETQRGGGEGKIEQNSHRSTHKQHAHAKDSRVCTTWQRQEESR